MESGRQNRKTKTSPKSIHESGRGGVLHASPNIKTLRPDVHAGACAVRACTLRLGPSTPMAATFSSKPPPTRGVAWQQTRSSGLFQPAATTCCSWCRASRTAATRCSCGRPVPGLVMLGTLGTGGWCLDAEVPGAAAKSPRCCEGDPARRMAFCNASLPPARQRPRGAAGHRRHGGCLVHEHAEG